MTLFVIIFSVRSVFNRITCEEEALEEKGLSICLMAMCIIVISLAAGCTSAPEEVFVDDSTKLMWQASDDGKLYNFYEAIGRDNSQLNSSGKDACGDLVYAGYDDWRIPTSIELGSIVDENNSPAVKAGIKLRPKSYWTSTMGGYPWAINFETGKPLEQLINFEAYVICMRKNK
jgi:hypothetical protein